MQAAPTLEFWKMCRGQISNEISYACTILKMQAVFAKHGIRRLRITKYHGEPLKGMERNESAYLKGLRYSSFFTY